MTEPKNQEQLEGVGAAYTMIKELFSYLISNAELKRLQAQSINSVKGVAFCDSTISFFRRCLELAEEDFVEFIPFAPLPVNEKGEPYLPEGERIMVANLEVKSGARLQLFEEDGTPIPNKSEEKKDERSSSH